MKTICLIILTSIISVEVTLSQPWILDNTFDTDGKVQTDFGSDYDQAFSMTLQLDGKIIVAGHYFNTTTSVYNLLVARYNADGSLDNTFDTDGIVILDFLGSSYSVEAYAVTLQSDGKIVLAGDYFFSASDFALARLNTDGSLDNTFSSDGILTTDFSNGEDHAYALAVQPDGKIIAGGTSRAGTYYDFALARYNTDGSLDANFANSGLYTVNIGNADCFGRSVLLQSDGKIISGGSHSLFRLTPDGILDNSFGTGGIFIDVSLYINDLKKQTDDKFILGGRAGGSNWNFAIDRLNNDGTLDNTFGTSGRAIVDFGQSGDELFSMALQPDGKIIAAGETGSIGGSSDFALARLNSDGTIDNTFDTDGKLTTDFFTEDVIQELHIQSDGKLLSAGYTSNANYNYDFALTRYNSDISIGVGNDITNSEISVYPNPVSATFSVKGVDLPVNITIANATGQLVYQGKITERCDVSFLASGYYTLFIEEGNKISRLKLLKE